jgi:hypothetical protein
MDAAAREEWQARSQRNKIDAWEKRASSALGVHGAIRLRRMESEAKGQEATQITVNGERKIQRLRNAVTQGEQEKVSLERQLHMVESRIYNHQATFAQAQRDHALALERVTEIGQQTMKLRAAEQNAGGKSLECSLNLLRAQQVTPAPGDRTRAMSSSGLGAPAQALFQE